MTSASESAFRALFPALIPLVMAWKCVFCKVFICLTLNLLLSHFNSRHSHETGNIRCRFDGCDKEYTKVNSLVKHVRNRHRVYLSHCGSDLESDCFSGKYIL